MRLDDGSARDQGILMLPMGGRKANSRLLIAGDGKGPSNKYLEETAATETAPFFSVVVPTRNRNSFLADALRSVLSQTFRDFEVLVVDDGSAEDPEKVVRGFADPRVRYLRNARSPGACGARNTGILTARGEWVAFLDDDDWWLPQKLERTYHAIQDSPPEVGLIYTAYESYGDTTGRIWAQYRPGKEGQVLWDILYTNFIGCFSSVAVRKELLLQVGGLDEAYPAYQDTDLYVRIAQRAMVTYVDEVLVRARKGDYGRISQSLRRRLKGYELFWHKYQDLIRRNLKIRHRRAARLLLLRWAVGDVRPDLRLLPWVLIGPWVDPVNLVFWAREFLSLIVGGKLTSVSPFRNRMKPAPVMPKQ